MNPRVGAVVPKDNYKLEITFTNGEVGIFDSAHLLDFGVFREFQDIRYFRRARMLQGTVVWPHEQDICPDTRYLDSVRDTIVSTESGDSSEVAFERSHAPSIPEI